MWTHLAWSAENFENIVLKLAETVINGKKIGFDNKAVQQMMYVFSYHCSTVLSNILTVVDWYVYARQMKASAL